VRLLLDTRIFLWYLADSRRLRATARRAIAEADRVFVSAASIGEFSIKIGIGKLSAAPDDLVAGIAASGFVELPVTAIVAARVAALPDHHRDPFDRMLVAQAIHEPLHLLTADATLARYSDLVLAA
jgi:PIN domain nuclease of toxin-antitoxin system